MFFQRGIAKYMAPSVFQINDLIAYDGSGVCIIEAIGLQDISGLDSSLQYYKLKPLYEKESSIISPVNSSRILIRKLLTQEEAMDLIALVPGIEEIGIEDEKGREEKYKQALHSNNCSEWVRIIKTLSPRMEARALQKKTVDQIDQRYFRMAEDLLYGELAISLGIPKDQVRDFIADQVALPA